MFVQTFDYDNIRSGYCVGMVETLFHFYYDVGCSTMVSTQYMVGFQDIEMGRLTINY